MTQNLFFSRLELVRRRHQAILERRNERDDRWDNGWFERWRSPVVTPDHVPLSWRYDLDPETNPLLLERLAVNATFNAGAIEFGAKVCVVVRVEGTDRKSFFAVAESADGVQGFRFWDEPIVLPQTEDPDVNVYDMRVVQHEDGWMYGLFCTERKVRDAPESDTSSAFAACGIARTRDLVRWERLPDLRSESPQQRNVVLHPEFVEGQYALYTRPQDDFLQAGSGGGIGWALTRSLESAAIARELIFEPRAYHTIKEVKNGMGAPPIKTPRGWLHVAHGVRGTAAGLRYVLYAFLCDLHQPWKVLRRPGGYLLAPFEEERGGDVPNVVFSNGLIARADGTVYLYYASSDTRLHVATSSVARLLDYVENTPEDPLVSYRCVEQRLALIRRNRAYVNAASDPRFRGIR